MAEGGTGFPILGCRADVSILQWACPECQAGPGSRGCWSSRWHSECHWTGQPGWPSSLVLPSAQGMILEPRYQVPRWAPCREPDVGLDPRSPGSRPRLKVAPNCWATRAAQFCTVSNQTRVPQRQKLLCYPPMCGVVARRQLPDQEQHLQPPACWWGCSEYWQWT